MTVALDNKAAWRCDWTSSCSFRSKSRELRPSHSGEFSLRVCVTPSRVSPPPCRQLLQATRGSAQRRLVPPRWGKEALHFGSVLQANRAGAQSRLVPHSGLILGGKSDVKTLPSSVGRRKKDRLQKRMGGSFPSRRLNGHSGSFRFLRILPSSSI